jgi:hypothetical protein
MLNSQIQSQSVATPGVKASTSAVPHLNGYGWQLSGGRFLIAAVESQDGETATLALTAMGSTGRYYRMRGEIAELIHKNGSPTGEVRFLDKLALTRALAIYMDCVLIHPTTRALYKAVSHEQLAVMVLVQRPFSALPVLSGIMVGPACRPTKSAITQSGYDRRSGIYMIDATAEPGAFDPGNSTGDADIDALLLDLA